jgi:hypothetical protein
MTTEHNLYSSYREALLEHLFAGEVMKHLWLQGVHRIEVLKPQVDDGGYDLVLEANDITRHVQLKASHKGSSTAQVNVGLALGDKPSGCVVWIFFAPDTLALGPFYWLGGGPGEPLPNITALKPAKWARANAKGIKAERAKLRTVPRSRFERVETVADIVKKLFGPFEGKPGTSTPVSL